MCGSFSYGTDCSVLAGTSIDAYLSIFVLAGYGSTETGTMEISG